LAADAPTRALRSCPTRRSSDLRRRPRERAAGREAAGRLGDDDARTARQGPHPLRGAEQAAPGVAGGSVAVSGVADAPAKGEAGTDRKSTRLNSSHEWISYAVFC